MHVGQTVMKQQCVQGPPSGHDHKNGEILGQQHNGDCTVHPSPTVF